MHLLNADLHSHSTVSDGALAPAAVAELAHAGGVELWALTDHDDVAGVAQAREAALDLGMGFVAGTEISVSFLDQTVHVLGLGVDDQEAGLVRGLAAVREGRLARAQAMAAELARVGLPGTFEGAVAQAGHPGALTRTHFARHLIERGVAQDMAGVFRRYLGQGKPGFVPHRWAGLGEALGWIHGAGGVAVIAHPGSYRFTPTQEYALFSEFVGHGGRGVEVLVASHGEADRRSYAQMATEFGLLASRGSDFHAPGESRIEPGRLPDLPGHLTPVWAALDTPVPRRG